MNYKTVVLTEKQERELYKRIDAKWPRHGIFITGSQCDACGAEISDTRPAITGYASGEELGLCPTCATFVNTDEDMSEDKDSDDRAQTNSNPALPAKVGG